MTMTFTFNDLLLFQIALLAVFSPFAVIGPYTALTGSLSKERQRKTSLRVSGYSALFLMILAWVGEILLKILGISIEALSAAGGLVLILTSLPMIMKGESPRKKVKADEGDQDDGWETQIVSPLVFPLTMGAGSMSLVVTQASYVVTIADRFALSLVILIHGLLILLTYIFATPLGERLGGKGSAVVTRVGGIILLSLAFIIFSNGIKVLLPGLAG